MKVTTNDFYVFKIFFTFNFDNHNNCRNFINCALKGKIEDNFCTF